MYVQIKTCTNDLKQKLYTTLKKTPFSLLNEYLTQSIKTTDGATQPEVKMFPMLKLMSDLNKDNNLKDLREMKTKKSRSSMYFN